jgi:hypothetical protein
MLIGTARPRVNGKWSLALFTNPAVNLTRPSFAANAYAVDHHIERSEQDRVQDRAPYRLGLGSNSRV